MAIYRSYGVAELSQQYNPRNWSLDHEQSTSLSNEKSKSAREKYRTFKDLSYGKSLDERLDILVGDAKKMLSPAPVYVFFHGGGWTRGNKDNACYSAELVLENGGIFVPVNFSKIEHAPLAEIARQSQAAVAWVYHNIADYGGDPEQIYICGKSSGAQQAGMVLSIDSQRYEVPADIVKGAILISGSYDLEPLSLTERRASNGIDELAVEALSPARNLPSIGTDLILAYAENDSEEIRRQAEDFAEIWRDAGFNCAVIEEAGVDHFSIGEPMGNPKSALGRATLCLMGLRKKLG